MWDISSIQAYKTGPNSIVISIQSEGALYYRRVKVKAYWWERALGVRPISKKVHKAKKRLRKWAVKINRSFEGWDNDVDN